MAAKNVKSTPVKKVDKPDERKKALDTVLTQIEKDFGEGTVMKLGENSKMSVEAISTGSISLDMALGIGGVPKGRIVEIYGPESSGKTTVALHVVAEAQKSGGTAAFIDVEHALDPVYAKALGIDIDSLLVSQPDCGEDALEITEALVRSGAIDVVVVDSVAALVTRNELEGKMEDSNVGQQARLMSKALRKLTSVISRSNCVVIFINQLRDKIGVMFGSPETTTGGKALKYYASVRIDIRKMESLKSNGDIVATHTRAKVVKNKVAPPFRSGEFDIIFGEGISKEGELVDLGVQFDIIQKSGAWFSYGEDRIAQGRDNAKKYLKDHPEIAAEVEAKIRECMGGVSVGDEIAPAPAEEKPIEKKPEEPTENISIDIVVD